MNKKHIKEAALNGLSILGYGKNSSYLIYKIKECGHTQEFQITHVRKNNFKCNICFYNKLKEDAEKAGLILLNRTSKSPKRFYQFSNCKHIQEISISHVRDKRSGIACHTCLEKKNREIATKNNLEIVGVSDKPNYRLFKFKDCKHTKEMSIKNVQLGNFECTDCILERYKKYAKKKNISILEKGRNYRYFECKFNNCGHHAEIHKSSLRNSYRPFCKICFQNEIIEDAKKANLSLICEDKKKGYFNYRFNHCKHQKIIRFDHLRNYNFICSIFEQTSRELPSYVYLIKFSYNSFNWLKVGYAKNIKNRINQYGLTKNFDFEILHVIFCKKGELAHKIENQIHRKFQFSKNEPIEMKFYHKKKWF